MSDIFEERSNAPIEEEVEAHQNEGFLGKCKAFVQKNRKVIRITFGVAIAGVITYVIVRNGSCASDTEVPKQIHQDLLKPEPEAIPLIPEQLKASRTYSVEEWYQDACLVTLPDDKFRSPKKTLQMESLGLDTSNPHKTLRDGHVKHPKAA